MGVSHLLLGEEGGWILEGVAAVGVSYVICCW